MVIGYTATGVAPFLAETNPVTFGQQPYVPNSPLQTSEPISGAKGKNIFQVMGNLRYAILLLSTRISVIAHKICLSPYHPSPDGFGVDEYPLPVGANITQMHMIHRHGSRYPSSSESVISFGASIANSTAHGNKFTGELAFLNNWSYGLGAEVLVPLGRQELYDSGVLNYYNYGKLYTSGTKIVARTTTEDRMLKSAENFLAGFFGLDWTENANLLPIIEGLGYNNSLIGLYSCNRGLETEATASATAIGTWMSTYLAERTKVFQKLAGNYKWTVADTYSAQNLCPYETISYGYSEFCDLFTYQEWEGFEYLLDIEFQALSGFSNPTGRAQGIAWVQEFLARVQGHVLDIPAGSTNANITLDTNPVTFPVNQSLYLDFAHDASIVATLTAFGFTQFRQTLPATGPPANQQFYASNVVPFAGRTNIEIIKAPHKLSTKRYSGSQSSYVAGTGETYYIHFLQNQRTLPLHSSFNACEYRDDGWCELNTFLEVQKSSLADAEFEYACNGNWTTTAYGTVTNGVPTH